MNMNANGETWPRPTVSRALPLRKEPKLKLSLETRNRGGVMIVHCQGRIVYRDEAAALSRLASEILAHSEQIVLDLSGVVSMDSAGLGELALIYTRAESKGARLKCAGPNQFVRDLLELTNLTSVLEIHSTVADAVDAFDEDTVCADC